jgi:hypothetical protein
VSILLWVTCRRGVGKRTRPALYYIGKKQAVRLRSNEGENGREHLRVVVPLVKTIREASEVFVDSIVLIFWTRKLWGFESITAFPFFPGVNTARFHSGLT